MRRLLERVRGAQRLGVENRLILLGYVSATQFNREYRRAYGLPPGQDAARLRARPAAAGQVPVLLDGSGAKP
ncbi:hypothetical protein GCM10022403_045860 [Streptomyces coacervatus]|uniref:HTH araC/xylS-type domain-containing protein n=1 Tax=Streptomyces coacervatus TaxID=647381 RepID=A0ABP7I1C6_9ACTN